MVRCSSRKLPRGLRLCAVRILLGFQLGYFKELSHKGQASHPKQGRHGESTAEISACYNMCVLARFCVVE